MMVARNPRRGPPESDGLCSSGSSSKESAPGREVIAVIAASADPASVALHRSCGFVEVGRLLAVGFKHNAWHDTILMQRSLGS
jgi:phosphinothricin acetyltransferase